MLKLLFERHASYQSPAANLKRAGSIPTCERAVSLIKAASELDAIVVNKRLSTLTSKDKVDIVYNAIFKFLFLFLLFVYQRCRLEYFREYLRSSLGLIIKAAIARRQLTISVRSDKLLPTYKLASEK